MNRHLTIVFLAIALPLFAEVVPISADANGFPKGWTQYGKVVVGTTTVENGAIHIKDDSTEKEWGVYKELDVEPNVSYEFTAEISGKMEGGMMVAWAGLAKTATSLRGGDGEDRMRTHRLTLKIPDGIMKVRVFFYGTYEGTPDFKVRNFRVAPLGNPEEAGILKLKSLNLETPLKNAVIVAGDSADLKEAAKRLSAKFGAEVQEAANIEYPLTRHVIAIGNRANNSVIDTLYRRGFCYTDLYYPGKGGYELRSIHNPTGGGFNVILCGGSDDAGAVKAAELLEKEPPVVGHLMKLNVPNFKKPYDAYKNENYPVSGGGLYGWNYISGMLALFYQTGDTEYAKEFLRLAFPDSKAIQDLKKFNAESFDNPNTPLETPYHYCASQMILLWDLVEEHPVFTDEERLKVTRAFARQYDAHYRYTSAPNKRQEIVATRHHQWAHISLYALARYFNRDYPSFKWNDAIQRCKAAFRAANDSEGWIEGEQGITEWFASGSINPALNYLTLTDDSQFNPDGALANALRFWETHWDGSANCDMYRTAFRQTFNLAAEYTKDGKYLWFADLMKPYPEDTMMLGAAFRPTGKIAKRAPTELVNAWTAASMKEAERKRMNVTAAPQNAYLGLSWRDTLDATGDWLCFNCFNEGYRTAFKLLSIYGLRINGVPILGGFGNFLQTYRNGSTEKEIPTLGEVYFRGHAGDSVGFQGGVPHHAYSDWKRTILLRKRNFAIIADTITPSEKGDDLTIQANFQTASEAKMSAPNRVNLASQETWSMKLSEMKLSGVPECPTSSGPRMSLFETKNVGDRGRAEFSIDSDMEGEFSLLFYNFNLRAGSMNIYIDGRKVAADVPHFAAASEGMEAHTISFGNLNLKKGAHLLELEVASIHPECPKPWMAAASISFRPATAQSPVIVAAAGTFLQRSDDDVVLKRRVSGRKTTTTFTLIGFETAQNKIQGVPYGDNGAVFLNKEPMLAFCGRIDDIGEGALILLEKDRIAGINVTELHDCLSSEKPLMIDWKFNGEAIISGEAGTAFTFCGKQYKLNENGEIAINGCNHAFRVPSVDFANEKANDSSSAKTATPKKISETPAPLTFIKPYNDGFLAGAGKNLLVIDNSGKVKKTFQLDGIVQCAAGDSGLVFVGTNKEEIAAFSTLTNQKLWSFTSKIEPSVEATQKYYWFKSRYPGVFSLAAKHGIVYAGSACTMEIIDAKGQLVSRLKQTWGPCREITILPLGDDDYNVIGIRHSATDGAYLHTYNYKTKRQKTNYIDNMPGYRHFNTWGSLFRTKAFADDFDGDGKIDLLTDAQGMYCWLNLYDESGKPKAQLNFGPGDKNLKRLFIDWTVGDIAGDKRPEALIVTKMNQLLVIDGRCTPLWSADLPFQPKMVAANSKTREIAVLGDRNIMLFAGNGTIKEHIALPFDCHQIWTSGKKWFASGANGIYSF